MLIRPHYPMLAGLALVCLGWPGLAAAQSVVVIVTHAGTPEGAGPLRAAAIEAIAERGVRLIQTPDGEPCEEAECAAAFAAQTGADHTFLLAVRSPEEVELTAVPAQGAPATLTQAVTEADFATAVGAVIERFLRESRPVEVGFLMVDTTPPGARVSIDGQHAGSSPLRRSVAVGSHRVRVSRPGEEPREQTVEVRIGEEAATAINFDTPTDPQPEPSSPTGPTRTEPSPLNWVVGGALAVGGVIALISPLQTLAQDGQCVDMIENVGCVERVHIGAQTAVLLGIGIAALIAAVIVDAVAPIRVEVSAGPEGAQAQVVGRF